jgi:hypothetical protein
MLELARPALERLFGRRARSATVTAAAVALARTDVELRREAILAAREVGISTGLVEHWLRELHGTGAPALFVAIGGVRGQPVPELLVTPRHGHEVVVTVRGRQARVTFEEPAPNGAYLHRREWRRLGHYERPPGEAVVAVVRAAHVTAGPCIVDVPEYVRYATVFIHGSLQACVEEIPVRGELRVPKPSLRFRRSS